MISSSSSPLSKSQQYLVIIDTSKIVDRYKHAVPVFDFYKNNLKGIIEYMVYNEPRSQTTNVIDSLIDQYERSPQCINKLYTYPNAQDEWAIQALAEEIHEKIAILLASVIGDHEYLISSEMEWLHNDLIIQITFTS